MDAFSIINKHSEFLFFHKFKPPVEKTIFNELLLVLSDTQYGEPPPFIKKGNLHFVYILRDDMHWCVCYKSDSFIAKCGPLSIVDNLNSFHRICSAMIGTITQHSVVSNSVLIQELVMETMSGGYMQMCDPQKLSLSIYSNVKAAKESSILTISHGLFGLEKSAPTTASQQSLLTSGGSENKKKEVYVDIVEKIWAKVGPNDTILRAEVTGKVILHCFLPHSSILSLIFNSDLSTSSGGAMAGFDPKIQLAEVEFGAQVDCSELKTKKELKAVAKPGESVLLTYSLPSLLPHILPFSLKATHRQLTPTDIEIQLVLSSTTGMGSVAPNVNVTMTAPPFTSSVMSRTNGPRQQTVIFDSKTKIISWSVKDFPGSSQAYSYLRLTDAGEVNNRIANATLDFEVSKWVSSGLRIENVRLNPAIDKTQKWVRYLTTSDTVTFNFDS